jgi:hypothetical protein
MKMLLVRALFAVCIESCCLLSPFPSSGADSNQSLPPIIEAGFQSWTKGGGVDAILNGWQRGGLMEGSNKAATQARYFREFSSTLGNYKSYEAIQSKAISQASQVIYLSINFERGVVYGRFLLYRTDKGWVVQNMDFSERPEAIMPWLAVQSGSSNE